MARIDDLLSQARALDPALGRELAAAIKERTSFGLVFEDHLPEAVEMPMVPVQEGSFVRILPPRGSTTQPEPDVYEVVEVSDDEFLLTPENQGADTDEAGGEVIETVTASRKDVVAVARYKDTVYPGLCLDGQVDTEDTKEPVHAVINAENSHALRMLGFTHRESVDTIYIDPPYNTGSNSWIYNDRYVSGDDSFRHSKWLSFMDRRLTLARDLLKETGVIVVAIGDDEHHRLRMLMDKVFGEHNFISSVVWQGGRKNNARFISNGADYMLAYAKNLSTWSKPGVPLKEAPSVSTIRADEIQERGAKWRVPKPGVDNVLAQGRKAWEEAGGDEEKATALMRAWFKSLPGDAPEKKMARNIYFLPDGALARDGDISAPGGNGFRYDVLHPVTNLPVPAPSRGWRSTEDGMRQMIAEGRILFREDHTDPISEKRPLEGVTGQVALSVFDRQRTHGTRHLHYPQNDSGVFPDARFPYPKDHTVLMEWLDLMTPRDGVILDFFGGSGSTMEAVLRLNEENATSERTCILVTNNELNHKDAQQLRKDGLRPGDPQWEEHGVYRHVTKPRIETILTGTRVDGTPYTNPTAGRVNFFTLTYEAPAAIQHDLAFAKVAPALWLKAGSRGEVITEIPDHGWAATDTYAVLRDTDQTAAFLDNLKDRPDLRHVFVITDSQATFRQVNDHLPPGVASTRLYEDYLTTFKIAND
ncbi:site-specific DNA-methyltransferase [Corynebacterium marinum]|uniref:DNA methylase N-4/N-6 domain-containing protein n=1 Tax=Corynebacterium marinum DSM 44953 TaxID=1224162 RepID=A0A0B6TQP8_9CORY|nr:site-specific DNA-methyltransferase [Corynebacterium marinum]AJK68594.1 DNA methylase N-4/N-6 domain-containing protein [Corynebacterium marinum DSM 44953]GGO14457.1 hypothetical protein GCM10010980_08880 [Corynebacterium marinum]